MTRKYQYVNLSDNLTHTVYIDANNPEKKILADIHIDNWNGDGWQIWDYRGSKATQVQDYEQTVSTFEEAIQLALDHGLITKDKALEFLITGPKEP